MVERPLSGGRSGFYWVPTKRDVEAGCGLTTTPLGSDYPAARDKAEELNRELDAWREGQTREPEASVVREGTIDWWFHVWRTETVRWQTNLRDRSREPYERGMRIIANLPLPKPKGNLRRIGNLDVTWLTPRAVNELYLRLYNGGVGKLRTRRGRSSEAEMDLCRMAGDDVKPLHPKLFPDGPNPFVGLTRVRRAKQKKRPATRDEAYTLARCLRAEGHPHLGACALIAFEWHQRPENVLGGATTWGGYNPGISVRIEHWKTDPGWTVNRDPNTAECLDLELSYGAVLLYPEIEEYLADLPRLGDAIVMRLMRRRKNDGAGPKAELFTRRAAAQIVQAVREKYGLPDHLTLGACRQGGMTELGSAGVTEAEGMALSTHSTPQAFRLYVRATREMRIAGALKRLNLRRNADYHSGHEGSLESGA